MAAVKICGCRSRGDVELALAWGARYIGFILASSSRNVALEDAAKIARDLPDAVIPVAVLVHPTRQEIDEVLEVMPRAHVQLSGDELPEFVASLEVPIIKTIHVHPAQTDTSLIRAACNQFPRARILFDTKVHASYGGTGQTFSWESIADIARERDVFVAGGLTPENVAHCVQSVRPFGVDVRSGVETNGEKDPVKVHAFCKAVKDANEA